MTSIVSGRGRRIRPRRLVTFLLIAYGGAWLIELPLWLGNGLRTPHAKIYVALMMLAPAAAALVTVKLWPDGRKLVDVLGLRPTRPFRRWWWTMLVAWFGPAVLVALAVGISYAFGRFPVDWGTWSVLRASLGGSYVEATARLVERRHLAEAGRLDRYRHELVDGTIYGVPRSPGRGRAAMTISSR